MKIGIISDTHGKMGLTARAATVLRGAQVEAIFHCGDIGNYEVLAELAALDVPVYAVLGNCDRYASEWNYFPDDIGVELMGRCGEVTLGGKRIGFLHGDDGRAINELLSGTRCDYLFSGHTHEAHDFVERQTRCINPGALVRTPQPSCAVLDLSSDDLQFLAV